MCFPTQVSNCTAFVFNEDYLTFGFRNSIYKVITLLINRTETGIFNFQQKICQSGYGLAVSVIDMQYFYFITFDISFDITMVKHAFKM